MEVIDRIRQKPEHEKSHLAFFGALAITFVIAGLWVVSLPARFIAINGERSADPQAETANPFDDFGNLLENTKGQVGTAFEGLGEIDGEGLDPNAEVAPQAEEADIPSAYTERLGDFSGGAGGVAATTTTTTENEQPIAPVSDGVGTETSLETPTKEPSSGATEPTPTPAPAPAPSSKPQVILIATSTSQNSQ